MAIIGIDLGTSESAAGVRLVSTGWRAMKWLLSAGAMPFVSIHEQILIARRYLYPGLFLGGWISFGCESTILLG